MNWRTSHPKFLLPQLNQISFVVPQVIFCASSFTDWVSSVFYTTAQCCIDRHDIPCYFPVGLFIDVT